LKDKINKLEQTIGRNVLETFVETEINLGRATNVASQFTCRFE